VKKERLGMARIQRTQETENGSHNQIAKGTIIRGDIETEGVLRIDGTLIGNILSKGKVVIGSTGKVEGEVICQTANIMGHMSGQIRVEELLALQSSAKLHGDVVTGKLSIEPGAEFNATCKMGAVIKEINHGRSGKSAEKRRELAHAE